MRLEWEVINDSRYTETKRAKVIGGWMVVHRELFDGYDGEALTSIFVPDLKHEWSSEL